MKRICSGLSLTFVMISRTPRKPLTRMLVIVCVCCVKSKRGKHMYQECERRRKGICFRHKQVRVRLSISDEMLDLIITHQVRSTY